jgi:hypothetical protein
MATLITFLISAIGHEVVMACITKKFRGYGFMAMMLQLPIVMLQRTRWVKGKRVFNNVCFWCSMISGLSMVCSDFLGFHPHSLKSVRRILFLGGPRWLTCKSLLRRCVPYMSLSDNDDLTESDRFQSNR